MRHGSHKGKLQTIYSVEHDLAGGITQTLELIGECEYYFTPGCRATGPTYSCGGTPEEPAEVEYFNFKVHRLEITLWTDIQQDGTWVRQNLLQQKIKPNEYQAKLWNDWFEGIVKGNKDNFRDDLDTKVGEILYEMSLPPDRDDEDIN